jgi:3-oxoacyl-[acyl-carrier protein] reductase
MDLQLAGKIALVTGASRGLGFATAHILAEEGARVAINSRDPQHVEDAVKAIQKDTHADVIGIPGDITLIETITNAIQTIVKQFGGLDILIANAGGPTPGKFESLKDEDWYKGIELSLMSEVRLIRAALPYLRKSNCASVLTVASYSVKQPIPNLILSNSIRAATVGLTKSLALELGSEGIRFNSILPGWTRTERVTDLMKARARQNGTTIEDEIAVQLKESPLGRIAEPEEFGKAAAFFVSPAASYITGALLSIDGGMVKGTF